MLGKEGQRSHSRLFYVHKAKNYIRSLPKVAKKDLRSVFTKASSTGE